MGNLIKRLVREESGQSMAEYALLAALIAVVAVATLTNLGTAVNNKLDNIAGSLAS